MKAEEQLIIKTTIMECLNDLKLPELLKTAAKIGAMEALENTGAYKDKISQTKAYKTFGEGIIKQLVRQEKIHAKKTGANNSKVIYSLKEIEVAVNNLSVKRCRS